MLLMGKVRIACNQQAEPAMRELPVTQCQDTAGEKSVRLVPLRTGSDASAPVPAARRLPLLAVSSTTLAASTPSAPAATPAAALAGLLRNAGSVRSGAELVSDGF